jgi:hypothetical protein
MSAGIKTSSQLSHFSILNLIAALITTENVDGLIFHLHLLRDFITHLFDAGIIAPGSKPTAFSDTKPKLKIKAALHLH